MNKRSTAALSGVPVSRRAIQRQSLHEEIAERLRAMIQDGELPPGSRVQELELAESFGISRTPLREALKVLTSEGLVEHRPNRGFSVARVEVDEIAAIFEVLGALETLTGQLVCERADEAQLERIEKLHRQLAELHRQHKRAQYFRVNQDIHLALAEATGNPTLLSTYAGMLGKIVRARSLANAEPFRWDESLTEHEAFMEALRARDGALFGQRLREHNAHTAAEVLKALRALPEDTGD